MIDYTVILRRLLVHIKTTNTVGTGVLWQIGKNNKDFIVFSCKHNFCSKEEPCDKTCGSDCEFLLEDTEITVKSHYGKLDNPKLKIADNTDFACILVKIEPDEVLQEIFNDTVLFSPLGEELLEYKTKFRGYPRAVKDYYMLKDAFTFSGFIEDLDTKDSSLYIRGLNGGKKVDVEGVSGSGIFVINQYGKIFLIGIITDYQEEFNTFIGYNPFENLKEWFGNFGEYRLRIEKPEKIPRKRIENLSKIIKGWEGKLIKLEERMMYAGERPLFLDSLLRQKAKIEKEINIAIQKISNQ